jgi:hypothetical protein
MNNIAIALAAKALKAPKYQVDYNSLTPEQKASITGIKGDPGQPGKGISSGGTTGQVLVKKSNTNYDTEWVDNTINNTLTSTSTTESLSANQGKVLNDKITNKADINHNHEINNITGLNDSLNNKVDKVSGKQLSDENYTSVEKTKLAASGTTNDKGNFIITEPETKDYSNNNSRRTDSITIQNRARTQAYHKWWEKDTKLIILGDSRGSIGTAPGDNYINSNFTFTIRKPGYVFYTETRKMIAPYKPDITLDIDVCYDKNFMYDVSDIVVSYDSLTKSTSVVLPGRVVTLDELYIAIIRFHANYQNTDIMSTCPLTQNTHGKFTIKGISGIINFTITLGCAIVGGSLLSELYTQIVLTQDFKDILRAPYSDGESAGYINVIGSETEDIELRKYDDDTIIKTRTGDGLITISPTDVGLYVYLARTSGGIIIASSKNDARILTTGDNGTVSLFAGSQVQVVGIGDINNKLNVINKGVQKASLLIPHTDELT